MITEHRWSVGLPLAVSGLLDPLIERGELADAEGALGLIDPEHADADAHAFQQVRESRARLRLAQGRAAEALDDAQACGHWERAWGARNSIFTHYPWRSTAALAHLALDDRHIARTLAVEQIDIARRFGDSHTIGVALRVAGLAHEGTERLALLEEAAATLDGPHSPLENAKALADLGTALRRARRRRDAREPLAAALDLAHRCGATALRERTLAELRATGARPRKLVLSGVDALTASERRVAQMATEGLSNPEIAQALFITRKTVEMHLSNAYRKLEIGGRAELSSALGSPQRGARSDVPGTATPSPTR
jgi:DNA-binding CsgD family transcriptional regulator